MHGLQAECDMLPVAAQLASASLLSVHDLRCRSSKPVSAKPVEAQLASASRLSGHDT